MTTITFPAALSEGHRAGAPQNLVEHWNGLRWSTEAVPTPWMRSGLTGVAPTDQETWAVGNYENSIGQKIELLRGC